MKVLNILNGITKVLTIILRGLKFGGRKTGIAIRPNVIIQLNILPFQSSSQPMNYMHLCQTTAYDLLLINY